MGELSQRLLDRAGANASLGFKVSWKPPRLRARIESPGAEGAQPDDPRGRVFKLLENLLDLATRNLVAAVTWLGFPDETSAAVSVGQTVIIGVGGFAP